MHRIIIPIAIDQKAKIPRFRIVRSSNLDTRCWSSHRFMGLCHQCTKVEHCTLPEAKPGRVIIAEQQVQRKKQELAIAEEKLKQARKACG